MGMTWELHEGDCLEVMRGIVDNSIDSIVTDPPYELGFMNKEWDKSGIAYNVEMWKECYRLLKPGGYLLSFGGSRTYHRVACAIEDAGFIVHPTIVWVFGSGFPKATNLSKQLDKRAGVEREVIQERFKGTHHGGNSYQYSQMENETGYCPITAPATPEAIQWDGWYYGLQSLKPALEPICMAQKPVKGRMTDNVLEWGTGAVNIDGCRVEYENTANPATNPLFRKQAGYKNINASDKGSNSYKLKDGSGERSPNGLGRFPANLIHDGSEEVVGMFP